MFAEPSGSGSATEYRSGEHSKKRPAGRKNALRTKAIHFADESDEVPDPPKLARLAPNRRPRSNTVPTAIRPDSDEGLVGRDLSQTRPRSKKGRKAYDTPRYPENWSAMSTRNTGPEVPILRNKPGGSLGGLGAVAGRSLAIEPRDGKDIDAKSNKTGKFVADATRGFGTSDCSLGWGPLVYPSPVPPNVIVRDVNATYSARDGVSL